MQEEVNVISYDVIIIGAGPAGATCALSLKNSGLKVALFDKSSFPRDKVCGDAIPSRAINILKEISTEFMNEFRLLEKKCLFKKTRIFYEKNFFDFNWVGESYTCARLDFDDFLFSLIKKHTTTDIFQNASLSDILIESDLVSLKDKKSGINYQAKILIGADGANSITSKKLTLTELDRKHHVGSVRAYYSNLSNIQTDTTEVYVDKFIFPGYLWIFPLPGNIANVGYGMLSSEISKRKINLRKSFKEIIASSPVLKEKFQNAVQIGEVEGFGLPLGSRIVQISGNNFMLTGDAASLIDPISGEGIGNAMLSGKLAADQVVLCFNKMDFSAAFIKQYNSVLFKTLGPELKFRYKVQRIISKMPFLLDIVFLVIKNKWIGKRIKKMF